VQNPERKLHGPWYVRRASSLSHRSVQREDTVSPVDVFAQVMFICIASVAALVGLGLATRWVWSRTARVSTGPTRGDNDRLQRLEEAVDTIAVEIERMSEAQRFTAKLLLERGSEAQATQAKIPDSVINARG
jgi:hypothetical protein